MRKKNFKKIISFLLVVVFIVSLSVSSFAATAMNEGNYTLLFWVGSQSGGILVPLTAAGFARIIEDYSDYYEWGIRYCNLTRHGVYGSVKSAISGSIVVTVSPSVTYSNGQGSSSISWYPTMTSDKFYDYKEGSGQKLVTPGTSCTGSISWIYYNSAGNAQMPVNNQNISVTVN